MKRTVNYDTKINSINHPAFNSYGYIMLAGFLLKSDIWGNVSVKKQRKRSARVKMSEAL